MARFRVVNSSKGTYFIDDTVGDARWTHGMGLTFGGSDQTEDWQIQNSENLANQVCLMLNLLAPDGKAKAEHEADEDYVAKAGMQIKFQSGPIKEHGENGVQIEDVVGAAIERLRYVNGLMACRENAVALTHFETGLLWLNKRTAERKKQGVEGRHLAHAS